MSSLAAWRTNSKAKDPHRTPQSLIIDLVDVVINQKRAFSPWSGSADQIRAMVLVQAQERVPNQDFIRRLRRMLTRHHRYGERWAHQQRAMRLETPSGSNAGDAVESIASSI